MYKLKKEFKGQNVIVYTPDKEAIQLEFADQKQLEKAYKIKGNDKFISKAGAPVKEKVVKKEEPKKDK